MKYQVGDIVRIKSKNNISHDFEVGQEVTITEVYNNHYRADSENDYWWVDDDELEPAFIEPTFTLQQLKQALEEQRNGARLGFDSRGLRTIEYPTDQEIISSL